MDSAQNPTLDESGYFSPEEEEPEKEIKKPDGVEPERQTVPCDNSSDIVKALKAEIISLKKRQLPGKWIIQNEINSLVKLHLYTPEIPKYIYSSVDPVYNANLSRS